MNVGAILGHKGRQVITVSSDTPLLSVSKTLSEHGIGSIVVTGSDEAVVGIISERDIVRGLAESGPTILSEPVTSLMTEEVITCGEADTIEEIMKVMSDRRFRHMPVVEKGRLVGIISIGDVVKNKIASAEKEAEAMREYIVASR